MATAVREQSAFRLPAPVSGVDTDPPEDVSVRVAAPADRIGVRRVLDAAALAVEELPERLSAGTVLVATVDGRVVGSIVLAPAGPERGGLPGELESAVHVRSIAVAKRRRDRGIGTALVRAATERFGSLVADFDAGLRPFYRALGAEVRSVGAADARGDDRYWALIAGH